MATTDTAHLTGAEFMAQQRQEDRIAYAVAQLKEGVAGTCGHDPRVGREWHLGLVERAVRP
ncbi:hypothetical protein [Streptomyces sp. NPDC090026]|uniref:hypothetical protein n=1 Tax=Streptomyces sp. NPDC090026 TaxID=3365923 RepID=UPI00381EC24A